MPKELSFLPLEVLDDFPSFPFRLRRDEEFLNLLESVSAHGVLQPIIARPVGDRFQILSGHRRKRACEILRYDSVFGIVLDNLDDSEAMLLMLELNLRQRRNLLPSEKAFAYKMRYTAVNQSPEKPKNALISIFDLQPEKQFEESREQIRRYIRLTHLVPELLELVDEDRIRMRPAIEVSYLDEECQRDVVDYIDENESTPSHAQARVLRKLFDEGALTKELIFSVLSELKGNQQDRLKLKMDNLQKLIPDTVSVSEYENYIIKALKELRGK